MSSVDRSRAVIADVVACLIVALMGWTLLAGAKPCTASEPLKGREFEIRGEVLGESSNVSAGGVFRVEGKRVRATNGLHGGEYTLDAGDAKQNRSCAGCPCQDVIFADGFESGNTNAWISSAGRNSKKGETES